MSDPRQTELPMFEARAADPNVGWLERWLEERGGWALAREVAVAAGRGCDGDRWVRQLASASGWIISGQRGYKHLRHATADEVAHFVSGMEGQGREMMGRAERVRRNAHAMFG